jgi:type III secretion protein J
LQTHCATRIPARRYAAALIVAAALLLSGCKQAIYTRLTEAEANSVLLTLIRGGLQAEKRAGEEDTFGVWVADAEIASAIELLRADAQPSEHYTNLGEVFARNGLISSPTEERIRLIYGLQQELARTLSQIDGVLVARVHIVVPATDPFDLTAKPSSAAVFIKHRDDMNMQTVVMSVKDLVVRSVEGLAPETVSVNLFAARATATPPAQVPVTRFFGARVASGSVTTLWIIMAIPWVLVALLAVALLHAARVRELLGRWTRRDRTETLADPNDELPSDPRAGHHAT